MITKNNVEYINQILAEYGKDGTLEQDNGLVNEAYEWYKGYVKTFHESFINVGLGKTKKHCKKPLYMAKKVCEDMANLLFNEKCDIIVPETPKKILDNILLKTNTWVKLNNGIEVSFALGYGALVQGVKNLQIDENGYITDKSKAAITNSFVPAIQTFPLTFNDGEVEDIAFIFENTKSVNIVLHIKDNNEYYLNENEVEVKNDNYGKYDIVNVTINENKGINRYTFHTLREEPLFQIIKPNIVNNQDVTSPLGISIYFNAIDTLKAIDMAYDSLDVEVELGRKRVVGSVEVFKHYDDAGNEIDTFDASDILFYQIPAPEGKIGDAKKPILEDISGTLRVNDLTQALNQQLNVLTSKVGMGENYYNYEVGKRVMTATQVISENTQLFRTIKKHEILLEKNLIDMVASIAYLNNNFTNDPKLEYKVEDLTIQFDDSIIEDKQSQQNNDRNDVSAGLMSPVEYRKKYYGEDEDTALQNLVKFNVNIFTAKANELLPLLQDGAIDAKTFVELAYKGIEKIIPEFKKDEFIAKVEENVSKQENVPNPFDFND